MRVKVTIEMDYKPGKIAQELYKTLAEQWLSDYDWQWRVDESPDMLVTVEPMKD